MSPEGTDSHVDTPTRRTRYPWAGAGGHAPSLNATVRPDPARGKRVAEGIARQLEAKYPSAAASLREGLDEMFAVRRLTTSDRLARSLSCTNSIESMISVVRTTTIRVKRWKDTKMVRRWVGAGMLEAERSFRRIKGCNDMAALTTAIRAEVARHVAADAGETVTPPEYDQAAA